jgi:hypothetical protein
MLFASLRTGTTMETAIWVRLAECKSMLLA